MHVPSGLCSYELLTHLIILWADSKQIEIFRTSVQLGMLYLGVPTFQELKLPMQITKHPYGTELSTFGM
jgi:hypothetical protein